MKKLPLKSFTQLEAWRHGHQLVLEIHRIARDFPSDERFGLGSHIKKTATSITSNIAEGFGRRSEKEKIRFYDISIGSLRELQNQLLIAKDLHYVSQDVFHRIAEMSVLTAKVTTGLMKAIKQRSDP